MRASDFQDSTLTKMEFVDTDLSQSQLNFTKLKGIEFTTCNIETLGVNIQDVNGVIVNSIQALSLSTLLGLVIK